MAERHSILVRIQNGHVTSIQFCECCLPVEVEVRTYESDVQGETRSKSRPPKLLGDGRSQDDLGTYTAEYFESE